MINVSTTDYAWMSLVDGTNDLLLIYEVSYIIKKYIEGSEVKLKKNTYRCGWACIYCIWKKQG